MKDSEVLQLLEDNYDAFFQSGRKLVSCYKSIYNYIKSEEKYVEDATEEYIQKKNKILNEINEIVSFLLNSFEEKTLSKDDALSKIDEFISLVEKLQKSFNTKKCQDEYKKLEDATNLNELIYYQNFYFDKMKEHIENLKQAIIHSKYGYISKI